MKNKFNKSSILAASFIVLATISGCKFNKQKNSQPIENQSAAAIFDIHDDSPKIVATLGPASSTIEDLKKMIEAGLSMARVNASHGDHEHHRQLIANVRAAAKEMGREVKILVDLQGPKIRVDKLEEPLNLIAGETWLIGQTNAKDFAPNKNCFIPTVYNDLVKDAGINKDIFFDDGFLQAKTLEKLSISGQDFLKIKIIEGGSLKSNKGINLPGSVISAPSLTKKDLSDLEFAISQNVDAVGLSFVRSKNDVLSTKELIKKLGANTPVVAKIETPEAVENLREIIMTSDGVMVARGDLAVEIGFAKVPVVQRKLMSIAKEHNKDVITATQMLESMISSTRPTRAEADNIAHAIWQGSTAIMLSGESAVGKHPWLAIKVMKEIAMEAKSAKL